MIRPIILLVSSSFVVPALGFGSLSTGNSRHWRSPLRGLLLGDAVEGAAFLDEVEAVDGDDLAIRKLLGDDADGTTVVFRLAEGRDENGMVKDEEIDVGGGEDGEARAGDFACLG